MTVNLKVPDSWQGLDEHQLLHVFTLIACEYPADTIKTFVLLRWNDIEVCDPMGSHEFMVRRGRERFVVSSVQIAELIQSMEWLTEIPASPVRLSVVRKHRALPADFQEVPFERFIVCDNFYQGYLHTQNPELLDQLTAELYGFSEPVTFTRAQQLNGFYWWASLKKYLGTVFRHFFTTGEGQGMASGASLYDMLSRAMNSQIRALTKGDITKEKEILAMDTWRALTELDAQVREYEELKRSSK